MTGLIVALPPVSNMPGGALTYAFYAAAVMHSPIHAPGGIAQEFCPSHLNTIGYYSNTEIRATKLDFSLITTFGADIPENLPKPIVAVVHDGHTLYEFGGKEWAKKVDGFIVDVDSTRSHILNIVKNASIVRLPLPFIPDTKYFENKNRKNVIVSLGRIVPERGHRLVASLSQLGYNVWVIGQEVMHDEYGLYYKKVVSSGAIIHGTPSEVEKMNLLSISKVAMSFPFTVELDEPVEFNSLECISAGLFPIVANWQKKYFNEDGFRCVAVEHPSVAIKTIEEVFRGEHELDIGYNFDNLREIANKFGSRLNKFVDDLNDRELCSYCNIYIPVGNKFCAICGRK
jgi:glycosyltransferase involved in cell wall biosynthesis